MAVTSSLARPYAQAVFDLAREANAYRIWSDALAFLAALVSDDSVRGLIDNPSVARDRLLGLLVELCGDRLPKGGYNLLRLMIVNDRLSVLPDVSTHFEELRTEAEGTVDAELRTARPVNDKQRDKLSRALEKRLGRKVNLTVREDADLLGGAVIRAGDLVIDGSAKGRLEKLASALQR